MTKNIYCVSDIHNDSKRFKELLKLIDFSPEDQLYILGDIFDRGLDPVGLYHEILKYENIIPLKGNHDDFLAKSIRENSYISQSHQIIGKRLTKVDLENLAAWIEQMPLQKELEINGEKFLLAHAETTDAPQDKKDEFFTVGEDMTCRFLREGILGYTSVIGHFTTDLVRYVMKNYPEFPNTVWHNKSCNVFCIDCGNGYRKETSSHVRLACLRLNDKSCFYV